MAREQRDAGDLDRDLRALGIPIVSVILQRMEATKQEATGATVADVRVEYARDATPEQIAQGNAFVASYDWDAPPDPDVVAEL
jgi:hypothetical protein